MPLETLTEYIAAAAVLGTASYAIVDLSKAFWGGVSNCGFGYIEDVVRRLLHEHTENIPLSLDDIRDTLRANWLNGTSLSDQKAIAKSLIKLNFNHNSAHDFARASGIKFEGLKKIAVKIETGDMLTPQESDLFARFDLVLTAILDQAYQRADQSYRNSAKAWSILISVLIAIFGAWILGSQKDSTQNLIFTDSKLIWEAILLGLIATPIAPIAKDLTSALSAGVKALQMLRK